MNHIKYQRLTLKTFFLLLAQNSIVAIGLSFIWFALVIIKGLNLINLTQATNLNLVLNKALDLGIVFGLFAIIIIWAFVFLETVIRHFFFFYRLDEHGITIKKGLLHRQENSTPYRHIESIDINQSLIFQLLKMCNMHIIIGDEEGVHRHPVEVEFPPLDKKLADEIKEEIYSHLKHQLTGFGTLERKPFYDDLKI